jgi:predicted transcriptional regulator of viral defense system/very-short-patch-repair endonuclease
MPEHCGSGPLTGTQIRNVHVDRAIGELAGRQHGVVSWPQLEAIGVSKKMVHGRLSRGLLVPLHRGVYAVGHRRLRREGFWMAAVLAVGPDAALSHRNAAALHELRQANHERTEVTTAADRRSTQRIRVYARRWLHPLEVTVVRGVPTTSVARTLVDLAGVVPRRQLAKAVQEAERRQVFDLTAVETALQRTKNRRGSGHAALRAVLDDFRHQGTQLTRSELEERFVALCDAAGLPRPRMNDYIGGMEVDAVWRERRVAVELDGWAFHRDRHTFHSDREKGNRLTTAGWTVLRYTHDAVVRRPSEVAAQLAPLLAP